MSRPFQPKVITANRLREGDVVYLTAHGQWSQFHHEADLIADETAAEARLADATAQRLLIVGAYLADARMGPKGPEPTHFRETFRTRGPSNYNHGKQADFAS
jgi:hypothetical protein